MLDAPPQPDPLVGQRIGDYVVTEAVARGGMSVVYRARHPTTAQQVAIKVLNDARRPGSDRMDKLIAEAEAVGSIGHRNIIDIFGLGQLPDGRPFIIMELLEGRGLDEWLTERGAEVAITEVVEILIEICAPLAAAHRARVIHRDLKPSNVFLCRQPDGARCLKLLDFGLARKAAGDGVAEGSRASVDGTPDYMAPELARGRAISARTDLYALGCIAYRMLTGEVPFPGPTARDVMLAQVRAPTPRPSGRNPHVPPRLDELVTRLMAKVPDGRPASADEVSAELKGVLQDLQSPSGAQPAVLSPAALRADSTAPPPLTEVVSPPRRRWVLIVVAVIAVAIAPVVITLWAAGRGPARSFVTVPQLRAVGGTATGAGGGAATADSGSLGPPP